MIAPPPVHHEPPPVVAHHEPTAHHEPPPHHAVAHHDAARPVDPYATPTPPIHADHAPDPAVAASSYRSGLQQLMRGDNAGALSTFRGAAAANPSYAPTYRGLGLAYEKLGDKGHARAAFKRYLALSPNATDADQIRERMEHL